MLELRDFQIADFPSVKEIYQQGIDTGIATFQTEAKGWEEWDKSVLPECRYVAELDGEVVAWAALSAVSNRCVYAGLAEITIYVGKNAQGKGVGRALMEKLIQGSEEAGYWTLQAGIFPENKPSIALHEKCGFRIVGTRSKLGQLNGVWQDIVFMERRSEVVGV